MTPDKAVGDGEDLSRKVAFPQGSKAFLPRRCNVTKCSMLHIDRQEMFLRKLDLGNVVAR